MHVVLVARPRNDDSGRPAKPRRVADEDVLRARGDESVEEVLREPVIDLRRRGRRAQFAVTAREVDVDVEPVLMRDVIVHPPAALAADVADHDASRVRVIRAIRTAHGEDRADGVLVSVQPLSARSADCR